MIALGGSPSEFPATLLTKPESPKRPRSLVYTQFFHMANASTLRVQYSLPDYMRAYLMHNKQDLKGVYLDPPSTLYIYTPNRDDIPLLEILQGTKLDNSSKALPSRPDADSPATVRKVPKRCKFQSWCNIQRVPQVH